MPQRLFVVGIDPGKSTGIGVLRRASAGQREKVLAWCTRTFVTVEGYLKSVFPDRSQVKIFIEHPPNFIYRRNDSEDDPRHVRDRKNQMLAANRAEAKLLFEVLLANGWDVELVAPVREKKWDAKRFRLFTGSTRPANQHEMDAVRLAKWYADKR